MTVGRGNGIYELQLRNGVRTMKLKVLAGALACLAMLSTAHALECPKVSVTDSGGAEDPVFTAARIKSGNKLICQNDGKGSLGVTTVLESSTPITPTGSGWDKNLECAVTDGDASKCSVKV